MPGRIQLTCVTVSLRKGQGICSKACWSHVGTAGLGTGLGLASSVCLILGKLNLVGTQFPSELVLNVMTEAVAVITVCETVNPEEGNSWAAWNSKREMEQNKRGSGLPRCLRAPWRGHHVRLGPRLQYK